MLVQHTLRTQHQADLFLLLRRREAWYQAHQRSKCTCLFKTHVSEFSFNTLCVLSTKQICFCSCGDARHGLRHSSAASVHACGYSERCKAERVLVSESNKTNFSRTCPCRDLHPRFVCVGLCVRTTLLSGLIPHLGVCVYTQRCCLA
jgi:hypothetical protein